MLNTRSDDSFFRFFTTIVVSRLWLEPSLPGEVDEEFSKTFLRDVDLLCELPKGSVRLSPWYDISGNSSTLSYTLVGMIYGIMIKVTL